MNLNIIDIINKKRLKQALTRSELEFAFLGYLNKEIPDYQMSSLLMAICINDMTDEEIFELTDIFIKSGEVIDLSSIEGIKVDKHSTGGVGDKTTMVVGPVVAACGVKMAKMCGRGLGHTGGTIDKLESIKGMKLDLSVDEIIKQVNEINVSISSQTDNIVALDKVIYSLRDVTATVESIPLIAISIMSKKIACGADKILIDIKVGNGALIKNSNDAKRLSDLMIKIGSKYNREVRTIMTDMDSPLGRNVGNSLEVYEAFDVLSGKVNSYLSDLCKELSANLISMAKGISIEDAYKEVNKVIDNRLAASKFLEIIKYQGGDITSLKVSDKVVPIRSKKSGIVEKINAYKIGVISRDLGAGRLTKEDSIDYTVGVLINKSLGSVVNIGDILCYLYVNANSKYTEEEVLESFEIR